MKRNQLLKITVAALLAAMTCVATMIINIPIPATKGYINIGDCIVILCGIVLGPVYGGLAAGIGSGLADLLSGYVQYAPITFVIKGLMAVVVGLIIKNVMTHKFYTFIVASVLAELIMVGGYFVCEATLLGYGLSAAASIPANLIQAAGGIVISSLLIPVVKRIDVRTLRAK